MSNGGRRELVATLAGCLLGAALLLLATGRPWAQVPRLAPFHGSVAVTGGALTPLPEAVGWLGLAAVAGVLATRRLGRRAIGAVLALSAAGAAVAAAGATGRAAVLVAAGEAGAHVAPALTAWRWLAVAGAVLLVVVGLAVLVRGRRWPAMGARYDAPQQARPRPAAEPHEALWQALDRGEDPTG